MSADLELRTATAADAEARGRLLASTFLDDYEEASFRRHQMVDELDRTHIVVDGSEQVATAGVLSRDLSVPGAVTPAAHVTGVVVAPTHRRRGLLSRLMDVQLRAVRERGTEPIAALWASEGAIYGRYGYGIASWHVDYRIPTSETTLPGSTPPGRLRAVTPAEAHRQVAEVFDRFRRRTPGVSDRRDRWWEYLTADPETRRRGMSALRGVVYEEDGETLGYAWWRAKSQWSTSGPDGEVGVSEVVAENTEAYAALWRFLMNIDLTRTVTYRFATTDEPLAFLVDNAKPLATGVRPGLWVRVVDVAAALSTRRYAAPIDAVLEITDARLPENAGRWHLVGDMSSAKCSSTDIMPDLTLDVGELGAAYLGGTSLASLAAAGLVTEHQRGALYAASTAFGWHRQPAPIEVF
ncbi:GNAT family N-acetyltransferase [Phytoactinopolyspora mesophila]|uniref:GNAT family N-acetyltransferase n=1 Tax=Phytoactinopolyspora mesophila TaxID=2650750 RepID=A0A7K3M6M8_9ACTN|nr:GNAT family N-acetyltransferase [Phytoactinopolyspora mesophila]NDL58697.1 GNAT family N-acetyltransferase [Phytoactinopolyspora mesophila]